MFIRQCQPLKIIVMSSSSARTSSLQRLNKLEEKIEYLFNLFSVCMMANCTGLFKYVLFFQAVQTDFVSCLIKCFCVFYEIIGFDYFICLVTSVVEITDSTQTFLSLAAQYALGYTIQNSEVSPPRPVVTQGYITQFVLLFSHNCWRRFGFLNFLGVLTPG